MPSKRPISTTIGRMRGDRRVLMALIMAGLVLACWSWLADHPQHNPWALLDLRDPPGWATSQKLVALRGDGQLCRTVLTQSEVSFTALDPRQSAEVACNRPDRTRLDSFPFSAPDPETTCPVAAGLELWLNQVVQPAALEIFGYPVDRLDHFGAYSCRRLYGSNSGQWSEHATGNAIDISGFRLANGQRIMLLKDWKEGSDKERFLKNVRDGGCDIFATVLSPDYNAAHRDHFHFDQAAGRPWGTCR